MADSLLETLNSVRSKGRCDEHALRNLLIVAGSMSPLYRCLMNDPRPEDRAIVTHLVRYETQAHEQHDGLCDHLIISSYLLASHGNVDDCLLLWDAKMANFSTYLGLSDVLLVGAGIEETIHFLRQRSPRRRFSFRSFFNLETPDKAAIAAAAALGHIERAVEAGRFKELEVKFDGIKKYCEKSLGIA